MAGAEGREAAFERLYRHAFRHLYAYAMRRMDPHDVEDAISETFMVAWRRFDEVPAGDEGLMWLYGVARRVMASRRRSQRRTERLRGRIIHSRVESADQGVGGSGDEVVLRALSRLRPQDQEVLRLAEWEELNHAEIATVLGCSPNAAAIRLHRARRRFATALGVDEHGHGEEEAGGQ